MAKITVTIVGTVGNIYELRQVGENSVIDFSVAVSSRKKVGNEWVNGETNWKSVTAWGRLAENVAESCKKGDSVIIYGEAKMRDGYTKNDGTEVEAREYILAENVGLDLTWDTAKSERKASGATKSDRPATNSRKPATAKQKPRSNDFSYDTLVDDDDIDAPF